MDNTETIQGDIDKAKAHSTILDESIAVENEAITRWLSHQVKFHLHGVVYVAGCDMLPPRWRGLCRVFVSYSDAFHFLKPLAADHIALANVRRLLQQLGEPAPQNGTATEAIERLAKQFAKRRAWLLASRRKLGNALIGKTDPVVFASLNSRFGTSIDFAFLASEEGDQWLRGYVPPFGTPDHDKGVVSGKSGLTIATGFDVGQKTQAELHALGLPATVEKKLIPFAHRNFKGKTKSETARLIAKVGPIPVLTKFEADETDRIVVGDHLASAIAQWNLRRALGVPGFVDLPANWQTVLLCRTYQQGKGMPNTAVARQFYEFASKGGWQSAANALRHYPVAEGWYQRRVQREATKLEEEMPPPVVLPPDRDPIRSAALGPR